MKKEIKILLLIFIFALLIRVAFVYAFPVRWWDETVYSNLAYDLSKNPLSYSMQDKQWSDFIPCLDNGYCWPKIGFRAPLFPYILSIFYLFKLDFLVWFFMPLVGALSVILVYLLGKKLFNEKVALYSGILFALIPLHVLYSSRILTDALSLFFLLLATISFWEGYENKNSKYKVLFSLFLALAFLSRYTVLWAIPVFLFYFLIRDKSLAFLKDKYLWFAVILFFIVLLPWLVYNFLEYGNFLGSLFHGLVASSYWGGSQPWYFYFYYSWKIFSIAILIFLLAIVYIFYKRQFKKEIVFLLLFVLFVFFFSSITAHKEERYIIFVVPFISLIAGNYLSDLKYRKLIMILSILVMLFSLIVSFYIYYTTYYNVNAKCFYETVNYLNGIDRNYLIVSENPAIFYYYVKKENAFYPDSLTLENLNNLSEEKEVYFVFNKLNSGFEYDKFIYLKNLMRENYELEFECSLDKEVNFVYSKRI